MYLTVLVLLLCYRSEIFIKLDGLVQRLPFNPAWFALAVPNLHSQLDHTAVDLGRVWEESVD